MSLASPDLIAVADTPWGRVQVSAWSLRPLSASERATTIARLGRVTTRAAAAGLDVGAAVRAIRDAAARYTPLVRDVHVAVVVV